LLFLKYILNFFNNFNAFFQSRKILIHKLFNNRQQLIRQIGYNFLISEVLTDVFTLNVDNEKNIKNLIDIYVNVKPECEMNFLATLSVECALKIRLTCLNFYKTVLKRLLKHLP